MPNRYITKYNLITSFSHGHQPPPPSRIPACVRASLLTGSQYCRWCQKASVIRSSDIYSFNGPKTSKANDNRPANDSHTEPLGPSPNNWLSFAKQNGDIVTRACLVLRVAAASHHKTYQYPSLQDLPLANRDSPVIIGVRSITSPIFMPVRYEAVTTLFDCSSQKLKPLEEITTAHV